MAQNIVHETGYYSTGRISANYGARVTNPVQGPVFRQATAPARARIPQNAPRGRIGSSAGGPVQNPVTGVGPVFYPAMQAIRARLPQPPAGMGAPRGRVASSPGAPVRNPVRGPVFVLKPAPVRYVLPPWQPRAGRIGSSFGAVVQNPSHGPPVYAPQGPSRARLPQLTPRAGRVTSSPGAPRRNPSAGPVFSPRPWPVQAQDPLPRRGRVYATAPPAPQGPPPVFTGPPFYPARQAVRARFPLRPAGQVAGHAGAPAQNPSPGPAVYPAKGPVRAKAPLPPRGRVASNPGAPVHNPVPGNTGPVFYPRNSAQARLPLPRRGTCRAIRFYPGPSNPGTGPAFTQATSPARARLPLPPRGRTASNPGAPVANPAPPSIGPVFRQATSPARARITLPPRGRTASNPGGPVRNPVPGTTGPVFYPRNHARARQPLPRRGVARAIRFYPGPANPQPGAAFPAWHAPVQARQLPLRGGRVSSTPVTPPAIPVPNVVAVTGAIPAAVRAALPVHLRGNVRSATGTVTAAPPPPSIGPVFRQAAQPARIRPSLPPRGRVGSNPGVFSPAAAPGVSSGQPAGIRVIYLYAGRARSTASYPAPRNPTPGPVFRQAVRPAQARFPLPPRGRTASNPGGPVQNPAPVTTGPPFRQATTPARIRPSLPPRGRTGSNPGAAVRNPHAGPAVYPQHGPVRAHVPQVFSKGRVSANPGTPPVVPAPVYPWHGPVRIRPSLPARGRTAGNPGIPVPPPVTPAPVYPAHGPVRIRPSLPPRGRVASNPGIPVAPPPVPAPVYPLHGPVQARRPLPPHGRCITGNPGAPVRNPHQGAVFHSLPWPARTRVPQNAPRGRTASNPGGPVENIPFATLRFRNGTPFFQWPSGAPDTSGPPGPPDSSRRQEYQKPAEGRRGVGFETVGMNHLATMYVFIPFAATKSGLPYNPTSDAVAFAFMPTPTQVPQNTDWVAGSWDTDTTQVIYPYSAKCLVGPAGTITLGIGTYIMYCRVTDNPEIPVLICGQLQIS